MSPKKAKRANELPYIPLGPFQWRIPGIHYRVEYVEFFQGLILGATALSSIPYLTDNLGLPYELAWSCVIIEVFMYMLHGWLGDPVVPGWITPTGNDRVAASGRICIYIYGNYETGRQICKWCAKFN